MPAYIGRGSGEGRSSSTVTESGGSCDDLVSRSPHNRAMPWRPRRRVARTGSRTGPIQSLSSRGT